MRLAHIFFKQMEGKTHQLVNIIPYSTSKLMLKHVCPFLRRPPKKCFVEQFGTKNGIKNRNKYRIENNYSLTLWI